MSARTNFVSAAADAMCVERQLVLSGSFSLVEDGSQQGWYLRPEAFHAISTPTKGADSR
jgi:hypothetical protein